MLGLFGLVVHVWALYIGTLGFFTTLLFLFLRFLPMISIFEMRTLVPENGDHSSGEK